MNNDKKCRVCGDKAFAFNYNGLSCECCKMFFLRNALRFEKLKCRKSNECEIDFVTRKCCAKCRLKKCFEIGMKTTKVAKNNLKKSKKIDLKKQNSIRTILETENASNELDKNDLNPTRTKISAQPELSSFEQNLIEKLNQITSDCFIEERILPIVEHVNSFDRAAYQASSYAGRIVKFCKSFASFKVLNSADQLSLLKQFLSSIITVRQVFNFDVEKDGWKMLDEKYPDNVVTFVPFDVCSSFDKRYFRYFKKFTIYNNQLMANDTTLRNLIIAQLLFRAEEKISAYENVKYEHHLYRHLLERYLRNKFPNDKRIYLKLTKFIQNVNNINEMFKREFSKLTQIPEVAVEAFWHFKII